MITKSHKNRIV